MIDFEKNLLTTLLLAAIGVMGLIGVAFFGVYFLTDVDFVDPADERSAALNPVEAPETGLEDLGQYAVIIERPVFFPDRRLPVLVAEEETAVVEVAPPPEPDPMEPLQASIAGIILTPEYRVALVNDQVANKTMIMREGSSFEGEQAGWQLTQINARTADFVSADGQRSALELKVYTEGLVSGSTGTAAPAPETSAETDGESAQNRAELIRQRVAERRAELRARAAERAEEQEPREQEP